MFDPYREWLGITEERRPPTLYQLLGISPGETNPQVIDHSANRQLMRVQPFLKGPQGDEAKRIAEELKLARTTLFDPVRRAAYDAIFGIKKPTVVPPAPVPAPAPIPVPATSSSAVPWYMDIPTAPLPTAPLPAAPPPPIAQPSAARTPVPVLIPQNLPTPAAPVQPRLSFLDDPDPKAPKADEFPSSSDGTLPSAETTFKPQRVRGENRSPIIFVVGALAVGLVGAVIYFAMKPSTKPGDEKKVVKHEEEEREKEKEKEKPKAEQTHPAKKKLPSNPNDLSTQKKTPPPKAKPIDPPPPPPKADAAFKEATILRSHEQIARGLAVSPDGKQLLSAADDYSVLTWTAGSDKPARRYVLKSQAMSAAFFPSGKEAIFCDGGTVFVIDLSTNKIVNQYVNPMGGIGAMVLAPDGKHFLTACTDGAMRWWAIGSDQQPEHTIEFVKATPVDCVAIAKDGKTAIAGGRDGSLSLWDVVNNKKLKALKGHQGSVAGVTFSPDGKRAASVGVDNLGRVWDVASGNELFTLKGHTGVPVGIAYTPDNSLIITVAHDQTIRAWDAISGEALHWSHKASDKVQSLAIDPKDHFLIAGLSDGGIQLLPLPAVRPDSPDPLLVVKAPPVERLPMPSDSLAETAAITIRERYKADYALTSPEDKLALMEKLVSRARFAPEDPVARFALFLEARDLAIKAGRVDEALNVLDVRSKWFETDELTDKSSLLRTSVRGAPTVPQSSINAAVKLVEQAEKQARPDIVDEMMAQQELFAQSAGEDAVNKRIQTVKKHWLDSAKERETLTKLITTLDKDADDKEANLAFGKRLCFLVGDWTRGLAHLEKSGDNMLVDLAKKEKANPMDGKGQNELGDAWLAYADKAEEENKAGVWIRARFWLAKAEKSDLPNLEKIKVAEKRLKVDKLIPAEGTGYRPGEAVLRAGFNTLRSSVALETQWALSSGAEATKEGSIVLKADGTFRSRFKPQENWKISFGVMPDGREIKIQICGEEISLKPGATTTVVQLVLQRKGNKLSHQIGPTGAETTLDLTGAKLEPTLIAFKVIGPAEKDGMIVKNITLTGWVKPSE